MCFSGPRAPLSNLHPCTLRVKCGDGFVVFQSTEHAYHYCKLHWLGLPTEAASLLQIPDTMQMMRTAKLICNRRRNSPFFRQLVEGWKAVYGPRLLQDLLVLKAQQHQEISTILTDNSDKVFIEATPDRFWGCGLVTRDIQTESEDWTLRHMRGKNTFGHIVGCVAEMLTIGVFPAQPNIGFFVAQGQRSVRQKAEEVQAVL